MKGSHNWGKQQQQPPPPPRSCSLWHQALLRSGPQKPSPGPVFLTLLAHFFGLHFLPYGISTNAGNSSLTFSFFQGGRNNRPSDFFIVKTKVPPLFGLGLALNIELITVTREC